jgi:hypothetical protein
VARAELLATRARLSALAILLLAAPASAAVQAAPDIYLLAGQSNMSGRGALADLGGPERIPDPAIRLYGNDGRYRPALDPLDDAAGQVDAVSTDLQAEVGPGLFFARALRRERRRPILLIPCAKGGSSIGQWKPGSGRDTLYESCLARAKLAGGRVAGILWYQGESDTGTAEAAARWPAAFARLVAQFRRDLGASRLPFVFVQLSPPPERAGRAARYPAWAMLQAAQASLSIRCTAMATAADLETKPDELHLTTAGQRILGARLASAMRHLLLRGCR